jgi:hypothetical protein
MFAPTDHSAVVGNTSPTTNAAASPMSSVGSSVLPPLSTTPNAIAATRVLTFQPWTPQGLSTNIAATAASGSCWATGGDVLETVTIATTYN